MGIHLLRLLATLCAAGAYAAVAGECPSKCSCKRTNQADAAEWVKVRCGDFQRVHTFDELDFNNIAGEVVQLNLSNNLMASFVPKVQFVALQKLDISNNRLTALQDRQFVEVPNLKRLDASANQLRDIAARSFENLRFLERLKLNDNLINTIEKGTFDYLENLKQLDISNNPLTCDCELLWLLKWAENASVKLMSNPKCASPTTFKGISVKKLRIGEHVHCKSPAGSREMPFVEITPSRGQLVFEGDPLRLNCRAPGILETYDSQPTGAGDRIAWLWLDSDPATVFRDVSVENRYLEDSGMIDSSLLIPKLTRNHTGVWNCELISNRRQSKGVRIVVISNETLYCPSVTTKGNKGTYVWPRTVAGNAVSLPCEQAQLSADGGAQTAGHLCSAAAEWAELDATACGYVSETTRILEQFSKFSSALGKGGIVDSARHFKNYISDASLLTDVEDLAFAVRTVQSYAQFVPEERELGPILMDVAGTIMGLNATYVAEACARDDSCNKLIGAMEGIAMFTTSPALHKPNVALEIFTVKQSTFSGMTCTWYAARGNTKERIFHCATTNQVGRDTSREKIVEASVQVPASFFHQLRRQEVLQDSVSHEILVSMFADGKLFPVRRQNEAVVSAVVGIKLDDDLPIENLTDPINVMLRAPRDPSDLVPARWDATLNNGTGSWTTAGCRFVEELGDCVVFGCRSLGHYALRRNASRPAPARPPPFRLSHSAIYIGSLILFACLLAAILTYLLCRAAIQMPRKAKHSLVNVWASVAALCFVYVFGIYRTGDARLCRAVGLALHYLTLSSLLWMCVGANGMYKRLRRNDRTLELQDDELGAEERVRKPIVGLYFVGWGVALIVCGISGAVNMKEYSSGSYCFLSSEPALSALYVPFAILIITLCIYFSLIRCAMYSIVNTGGHLSEGTQATENVDLDLLEPNFPNNSIPSISTKSSSETEDPEHAPIVQLKAYIIFLFIYVLTWLSCAFSTVQPRKLRSFEEVFCIAYAILAIVLGSFTVFFYCIARNDIRTQYVVLSKRLRKKRVCFFLRTRNVSDTNAVPHQIQVQPLPPVPAAEHRSSSRSSSNNTKSNNSQRGPKAASDPHGIKINNVNLVVLHRQQYRGNPTVPNLIENPTNTAEMFYNPHQSTVARKFFRKQKRNMMKHTNLVPKRTGFDASSVGSFPLKQTNNDNNSSGIDHQSIFSTNSKVNNTNIHVEKASRKHRNDNNNPNILLLDSYDEEPAKDRKKRGGGGAETRQKQHKKRQNVTYKQSAHDNMRSVSQQCTLEYSSEAVSDSILDQRSPEKAEADAAAPPATIYVNPSFAKQSRASSVSASEIDELYQEIRGGRPRYRCDGARQPSPCFSDSEITSGVSEVRYRNRRDLFGGEFASGKVESNV